MKTALIASAAAFLLLAIPVRAQDRASQLNFGGRGGGASFGGAGGTFSLPVTARPEHYTYTYAQGSTETYVPTRFVSFETGLQLAKELQAYRPKSLGEIAAQYRAERKRPE